MFRSWTLNFMPRLGLGLDCNVVPALHPSDYSVIDDPAECIIKPVLGNDLVAETRKGTWNIIFTAYSDAFELGLC